MPVQTVIKLRRATAADWTTANPVLALGEPGLETDTGKVKYGDGTTAWASLAYSTSDSAYNLYTDVKNSSGSSIAKGTPVYVSSANGTNMLVSVSTNATEVGSSKTLGLLTQTLANNGIGRVTTQGLLSGLDTSAATAGDPVWLGVNGALIYGAANKPVAPAHMVFIGIVTRVSATVGEIFVRVQNGFEIDELHDVSITSKTAGDILTYDSASGLWQNKQPLTAGVMPLASYETTVGYSSPNKVLTASSPRNQFFTGSTPAQGLNLPATSTLTLGDSFVIYNNMTTAYVSVNNSTGGNLFSVTPGTVARFTVLSTTNDSSYQMTVEGASGSTGTGALVLGTSPIITLPSLTLSTVASNTAGRLYYAGSTLKLGQGASAVTFSNDTTNASTYQSKTNGVFAGPGLVNPSISGGTAEAVRIVTTAFSGYTFYVSNNAIQYITTAATANGTVNIAWASGVSLDSSLLSNNSTTITLMITNGATPYRPTAWQIDGIAVTPKWQGGTAPSAGNANAVDIYQLTIIKTAAATYTVLGTFNKFA